MLNEAITKNNDKPTIPGIIKNPVINEISPEIKSHPLRIIIVSGASSPFIIKMINSV
jgi:hypothetical protein